MVLLVAILFFIAFSIVINLYPPITTWDRALIEAIQRMLNHIPVWVPSSFDNKLYAIMITLPILISFSFFFCKKKYFDMIYFGLIPIITYGLSNILKHIVERPRPPVYLHLSVNPDGFSYVSNHTVISFCLWGMFVYYLINYCENKIINGIFTTIAIIWIFLIGFSRIWLGVHNPTDVIAAYMLGAILLSFYIKVRHFIQKYIGL